MQSTESQHIPSLDGWELSPQHTLQRTNGRCQLILNSKSLVNNAATWNRRLLRRNGTPLQQTLLSSAVVPTILPVDSVTIHAWLLCSRSQTINNFQWHLTRIKSLISKGRRDEKSRQGPREPTKNSENSNMLSLASKINKVSTCQQQLVKLFLSQLIKQDLRRNVPLSSER